jgi:SAM-dependent methyltransferase
MNIQTPSRLGGIYQKIYGTICGRHPFYRPWHFQWIDTVYLYKSLHRILPKQKGVVLDVGCGNQPYRELLSATDHYIGLDMYPGSKVDIVVDVEKGWPFKDESIDVVLCTQVLEHVSKLNCTLCEIRRVLRSGGKVIASFPFLYNEHGTPHDYHRFSVYKAKNLFHGWQVLGLKKQGGIGSTLVLLFLNWFEQIMNHFYFTRLLKAPFLPLWFFVSFLFNTLGLIFDKTDVTDSFYSNLLLVVCKC